MKKNNLPRFKTYTYFGLQNSIKTNIIEFFVIKEQINSPDIFIPFIC